MKKLLAIILALTIVFGLCACGGGGASPEDETTPDGKVKLSIGLPTNALVLDHDNNELTKWIEEKCNVELEFIEYAGGTDVPTQISTTIAARQELPDILLGVNLGEATITRYGKDGYLRDLSEYYADKEGASKTFWDRMTNELSESDQDLVLRTITDPGTGAIYSVPLVETSLVDKLQFMCWINVEWLDKLGLEKPTNNEELYEVLKAFKENDCNGNGLADEIPLFGSQKAGYGANVVDWLINLFCYYNTDRPYSIDENGKLSQVYLSDAYREGLKFVNKLYKEELLTSLAWTASQSEMQQITTPSSGTALCGIFLGHLTVNATQESPVLYQYEPLQTWGCAVRKDTTVYTRTFITEDCANPDKAFELLMTLWSWDGSMRARYGQYGVNWTDATPGAQSAYGLDATFKLIADPLKVQNTCKWAAMTGLNVYAEGETAEIADETTEWMKTKAQMHAEIYNLFVESETNNNPDNICPKLVYTEEEQLAVEAESTNVADRYRKAQTEFCSGVMDPNDDAAWQAYLDQMAELGSPKLLERAQKVYDRG